MEWKRKNMLRTDKPDTIETVFIYANMKKKKKTSSSGMAKCRTH